MPELKYDFRAYLAEKAKDAGCTLLTEHYTLNEDRVTFILRRPDCKKGATVSVSGLEEIQNSSKDAIQDLLNGRFAKALAAMETGDDSAGH